MGIYSKVVYVAVKILVAEAADREIQEAQIVQELVSHQPRPKYVVYLLDSFELKSPNGCYQYLIFEFLGPNIRDTIDIHYSSGRLLGKIAKAIAKQSLFGLIYCTKMVLYIEVYLLLKLVRTILTYQRSIYPQYGLQFAIYRQSYRRRIYSSTRETRNRGGSKT